MSSSTGYRKVDELTEAGLLEESIRLDTDGANGSEYRLAVSDLSLELAGGVKLTLDTRQTGPAATPD